MGRTAADVRDIIVEGESGILAISHPKWRPIYEPSKRRLTWPNGARATTYSADEPDSLRGAQHDLAYVDELAAYRFPDAWDQLMLGLRLGKDPRCVVTTTPRPTKIIRDLINSPNTLLTRGSSYDNKENLATQFIDTIIARYEGTTLGRQELHAEILDDIPGALWTRRMLDENRVNKAPSDMRRVVVGIDPAVTSNKNSDETGIVVVGMGEDGRGYVLADISGTWSPDTWARKAVAAYHEYKADRLVAEVNNGGDLVERVIRTFDAHCAYTAVHASKGKRARAEPVAALYEQGKVKHVGAFPQLEDQMCTYIAETANESPDRMDALVWACSYLFERQAKVVAPDLEGLGQTRPWAV
jgi:predicted phage terminase large subunit-like protein